jgi:hypothetical protein
MCEHQGFIPDERQGWVDLNQRLTLILSHKKG